MPPTEQAKKTNEARDQEGKKLLEEARKKATEEREQRAKEATEKQQKLAEELKQKKAAAKEEKKKADVPAPAPAPAVAVAEPAPFAITDGEATPRSNTTEPNLNRPESVAPVAPEEPVAPAVVPAVVPAVANSKPNNRRNNQAGLSYNPDYHTLLAIGTTKTKIVEYYYLIPGAIKTNQRFQQNTFIGDLNEFKNAYNIRTMDEMTAMQKLFGVERQFLEPPLTDFLEKKCKFPEIDILMKALDYRQTTLQSMYKDLNTLGNGATQTERRAKQVLKWLRDTLAQLLAMKGSLEPCHEIPKVEPKKGFQMPTFPSWGSSKDKTDTKASGCFNEDMIRDLIYVMVLLQGKAIPEMKERLETTPLEELLAMIQQSLPPAESNTDPTKHKTIRQALEALSMLISLGIKRKEGVTTESKKENTEARDLLEKTKQATASLKEAIWKAFHMEGAIPDADEEYLKQLLDALKKKEEEQLAQKKALDECIQKQEEIDALKQKIATLEADAKEEPPKEEQPKEEQPETKNNEEIVKLKKQIEDLEASLKLAKEEPPKEEQPETKNNEEIDKLKKQIEDLEASLKLAQEAAAKPATPELTPPSEESCKEYIEKATEALKAEIENLRRLLKEANPEGLGAELASLEGKLKDAGLETNRERAKAKTAEEALDALRKECDEMRARLEEQLASKNSAHALVVAEKDEQLATLQASLDEERKRYEALSKEKAGSSAAAEATDAELETRRKRIEELEGQMLQRNTQIASLTGDQARLQAQLDDLQKRLETLQGEKDRLEGAQTTLQQQVDTLTKEKDALFARVRTLIGLLLTDATLRGRAEQFIFGKDDPSLEADLRALKSPESQDMCEFLKYLKNTMNMYARPIDVLIGRLNPSFGTNLLSLFQRSTDLQPILFVNQMTEFLQEYFAGDIGKWFDVEKQRPLPATNYSELVKIIQAYPGLDKIKNKSILEALPKLSPFFMDITVRTDGSGRIILEKKKEGPQNIPILFLILAYIQQIRRRVEEKYTRLGC